MAETASVANSLDDFKGSEYLQHNAHDDAGSYDSGHCNTGGRVIDCFISLCSLDFKRLK